MADVFKLRTRSGEPSAVYYGKVKTSPGKWKREPLYSDKQSSRKRLAELQAQADKRHAGILSSDTDRLALPITTLAEMYAKSLSSEGRDPDHQRIAGWMTDKLIELGGWKFYRDITRDSMEKILQTLERKGRPHRIAISSLPAKALVNWLLPEGMPSPLAKVKRVREKGAKKTRERRAATAIELAAMMAVDMPDHRRLAYALAAYNGLRRNEAEGLTWDGTAYSDYLTPRLGRAHARYLDDPGDLLPQYPDQSPDARAGHVGTLAGGALLGGLALRLGRRGWASRRPRRCGLRPWPSWSRRWHCSAARSGPIRSRWRNCGGSGPWARKPAGGRPGQGPARAPGPKPMSEARLVQTVVVPIVLAAVLMVWVFLQIIRLQDVYRRSHPGVDGDVASAWTPTTWWIVVPFTLLWGLATIALHILTHRNYRGARAEKLGRAAVFSGLLGGCLFSLLFVWVLFVSRSLDLAFGPAVATFGPPLARPGGRGGVPGGSRRPGPHDS